ncbi:hypothetical protein [Mesobacillus subterraneus]|uniref:Uncharacterized protein n=1 Tax=Mesobacillus subterraneus TaxID=285983 RepID=A0A427TSJ2_9BACI|nr:hypothetical protein [Mesobacillus subterraneus]RSD27208.1 hypothetical protein EJA10_11770 [Mesobacillus subterraneus]
MIKMKKRLILILAPILLAGCLFFYDAKLDVYTNTGDGVLVFKDNEFHRGYETYQKYYTNGEKNFEIGRMIGKTDNSKFLGFKESVWQIKGVPDDEVVFVKGLMIEGVYERK